MVDVRLAVDIGGTFTDIALEANGGLITKKLLTPSQEPAKAGLEGIQHV